MLLTKSASQLILEEDDVLVLDDGFVYNVVSTQDHVTF
jgi:hypothetical protein